MEPALDWTEVESSNVKRVGFHEPSETLVVEFNNGTLYGYMGSNLTMFTEMVHSESVGRYLNTVVKALCPYIKYEDRDHLNQDLTG